MTLGGRVFGAVRMKAEGTTPPTAPCIMVVFGATGDQCRRLLMPALYNLVCDGLLSERFAVLGTARRAICSEEYRALIGSKDQGIERYHTRRGFDQGHWATLAQHIHYLSGNLENTEHYRKLGEEIARLDAEYQTDGNILFYLATSPDYFGTICDNLFHAGFNDGKGWTRIIVEKPFAADFTSAQALNKRLLHNWGESQIYRIDHYLGKETVQNLLAFRFSNGMFEPLWNSNHIDNIQFSICESVDIEGRGGYYDSAGVLRDMVQNHMLQMLAYVCMETPRSFSPEAIRDEKAKLLESVHIYSASEVPDHFVRGQYGPSCDSQGRQLKPGYRQEKDVAPQSTTETYTAGRLSIDNQRWSGVPIYVRSGKALCKRSTEIVVQFKCPPQSIFQGTPVDHLSANRLVFHIQPNQGIELLFQAKIPGQIMQLQTVDMRFSYGDIFRAMRSTGYEILIHACTHGDTTLFSRGDLVESAWKIVQPILDYWKTAPAPDFPNYNRTTWGPKIANDLVERDGRHWFEVVTPDILEQSPLFRNADPLLLNSAIMSLHPTAVGPGVTIVRKGDEADEMYLICRGEVEVIDDTGNIISTLKDGDFFGEIGLLLSIPRTATVRTKTLCDFFVLHRSDFVHILNDHPQFAETIMKVAKERYKVVVTSEDLLTLT
jgi:glucose-6-phosphate 1-dehydrogenase